MSAGQAIEALLREKRILVCCGSGGVGKTTLSAALGLAAARRGRRVLVCTIDPARRLANALGIAELGNEAYEVPREIIAEAGVELPPGGSFHAMMLDTKRTFDRLIERHAPSEEVAASILGNHVYIQFSSQLAGSQEYMAMEKLYELHSEGGWDLIILDTPPSKHALDFLHAPRRLSAFLDGSVLRWFLKPLKGGGGLAGKVTQKVLGWLDTVFGMKLLEELAAFFAAFETLWGGFKERADRVNLLLSQAELAAFLVVSSATRETIAEALYFDEQLVAQSLPMAGFLVNRVHPTFAATLGEGPLRAAVLDAGKQAELVAALGAGDLVEGALGAAAARAVASFCELEHLAAADRGHLAGLRERAELRDLTLRAIPAFERDVCDLVGLAALDEHLVERETVPTG